MVLETGEAGSIWRIGKLHEFKTGAAKVGLENNEEYQCLVSRIAAETAALQQLWQAQKVCPPRTSVHF